MHPLDRLQDCVQYLKFSSGSNSQLNFRRQGYRAHNIESALPTESRGSTQANIEDVHRSPEDLTSELKKRRARAEAALKSKDVTKVSTLALEKLHPHVIAHLRDNGALDLPAEATCDELVGAFFDWAAPLVPILNRNDFLRSYHGPNAQPSLLLIQAVVRTSLACHIFVQANRERRDIVSGLPCSP